MEPSSGPAKFLTFLGGTNRDSISRGDIKKSDEVYVLKYSVSPHTQLSHGVSIIKKY